MLHRLRQYLRPLLPARHRHRATLLLLRVTAIALRGNRVQCPCCGRGFRRFLRYPTSFCPGCGSYERQRLLCLYLDRHPELLEPAVRILHVAPEDCIRDRVLRIKPRAYLSIDREYPEAMRQMDVTRLELPEAGYDLVLISHVLDVVADEAAALRELYRVLAAGGVAIVQAPPHLTADEPRLVSALTAAGFAVETGTVPEQADAEAAARLGLLPGERLLICRKPPA